MGNKRFLEEFATLVDKVNQEELLRNFPDIDKQDVFRLQGLLLKQSKLFYSFLLSPEKGTFITEKLGENKYKTDMAFLIFNNIELVRRLEQMATTDPLTGLYNRFAFDSLFHRCVESSIENLEVDLSVAMFDIDYFKSLNDVHGHKIGDTVLRGVTDIIKNNLEFEPTPETSIQVREFLSSYSPFERGKDLENAINQHTFNFNEPIHSHRNKTAIHNLFRDTFGIDIPPVKIDEFLVNYIANSKERDFATVYDKPSLGRFGGEEIIVAFPTVCIDKAKKKAEKIRNDIEEKYGEQYERPIKKNQPKHTISGVTVSGGVQSFKEYIQLRNHLKEILNYNNFPRNKKMKVEKISSDLKLQIDSSLYVAKDSGRNKIITFESALEILPARDYQKFFDNLKMEGNASKAINTMKSLYLR